MIFLLVAFYDMQVHSSAILNFALATRLSKFVSGEDKSTRGILINLGLSPTTSKYDYYCV